MKSSFFVLLPIALILTCLLIACQPDAKQTAQTNSSTTGDTATQTSANEPNQPTEAETETTGETENARQEGDFGLLENESFGKLKLGLPDTEIISLLGKPTQQSKPELWGADGLHHATWIYQPQGITLNMSTEDKKKYQVFSITLNKPSVLKTARNIGIGSTYNEALQAYKKEIDPEFTDSAYIIAGSMYGGLVFSFVKGQVNTIFLGAAAE